MTYLPNRLRLSSGNNLTMSKIYVLSSTQVDGAVTLPVIKTIFHDINVNIDDYDVVIFTSKNAVVAMEHSGIEWNNKPSIAIGEATAEAIRRFHGRVSFVSGDAYGDELGVEITRKFRHLRFLYPRAKEIASDMPNILRSKGADLTEVIAYETVCNDEALSAPEDGSVIVFSSPSTVKCFVEKFGWRESYKCVAIGKTTANAIDFCDNVAVSPEQTLKSAVFLAKNLS